MQKILIVEDDAAIASAIAKELGSWGYEVAKVDDFSNVMERFVEYSPQLVLLDLSLPFRSGFHWCTEIRKQSNVPVMFISSSADSMNQLTALHLGGDDFIAKPFDLSLLVAKVQALLRRSYDFQGSGEMITCGDATLNLLDMTLACGDHKLELTKNEFRILQLLFENKGRVQLRDTIMRRLWEDENFIDDNTLTVNVNRLRKKLSEIGLDGFIVTKKGEGYLVSPEVSIG